MPQDDRAAAPAPVTPRTFRNRRRSMESVMLVMAYGAVASHVVLHVAAHAPPHAQRRDFIDLRHVLDLSMTRRARLRAERLDVSHMREADEPRQRMDPHPLGRLPLPPRVPNLLDLGLMRRGRSADQLMAPHARLQRRNPGLARDRGGIVAVHAGDLVLPGMNVVAEEDRRARPLEIAGAAGDGGLVTRGNGLYLLGVSGRRRGVEE